MFFHLIDYEHNHPKPGEPGSVKDIGFQSNKVGRSSSNKISSISPRPTLTIRKESENENPD
jgi:hypothetical protein